MQRRLPNAARFCIAINRQNVDRQNVDFIDKMLIDKLLKSRGENHKMSKSQMLEIDKMMFLKT
jgi:hypothetical protein